MNCRSGLLEQPIDVVESTPLAVQFCIAIMIGSLMPRIIPGPTGHLFVLVRHVYVLPFSARLRFPYASLKQHSGRTNR